MRSNPSRSGKQRFWEKHIAQWNASGLSQVEYCRTNKIALSSFQNWKRKLKPGGSPPTLVEVPLQKSLSIPILPAHTQLCLVVGQHYRIEICKGFDSEDLERVVRVLGRI
jgi:hypothetical protein